VATIVISTDDRGQQKTDQQKILFLLLLGIDYTVQKYSVYEHLDD
jgi:hypothetical protein